MSSTESVIQVSELEKMSETEKKQWERRSIYKLPACVKITNKTPYTPQLVSFGPYHYGNENLKDMELHKERALNRFLIRSKLNYKDCHQSLLDIVGELMDAYEGLDSKLYNKENPDAFLNIMIRDGIFMLEIFQSWGEAALGYADNDPIFGKHGYVFFKPQIERDMLILENQIPVKVLQRLCELRHPEKADDGCKVAASFFRAKLHLLESLHLLDLCRTYQLGLYPSNTKKSINIELSGEDIRRSIVELHDAGIKIKRCKHNYLRDISFKNGILRLPVMKLDYTAESMVLNLIAFEQFHTLADNDVMNFTFFMVNLISNESDIRLLRSKDILWNDIGSDNDAVNYIKSLSRGVSLDRNSPVAAIYKDLSDYSRKHSFRAEVHHRYFSNPWAKISFVAGALFFGSKFNR